MKRIATCSTLLRISLLPALLLLGGCKTLGTHDAGRTFEPVEQPQVASNEIKPVRVRSTTDLLRAADDAFRQGNAAQEQGDAEAALRHYKQMLELLIEADPDPVIFYNLRSEFSRILDNTSAQAYIMEGGRPREWSNIDMASTGVVGDLPFPVPLPDRVIDEIEEIQEAYPRGYQAGLNRSFKYAPWIRQQFAEAGLPQDLAWLAMVESQFKSTARSRAGAVGMWQFMPATARRYGLRVDRYVDERRDWQKATKAAVAYLSDLHDMFGEWPLAVSAYNMGEGGLDRTVAMAGGEKDLWKILDNGAHGMHRETQKFFPKLVASVVVAASPERYGFELAPEQPDRVLRVPVQGSYSLNKLAKASAIDADRLEELNPDLVRGATPPTGTHMVAVPADDSARFIAALKKVDDANALALAKVRDETPSRSSQPVSPSGQTYKVRRGDTLSGIAARYGVSTRQLMEANNIRSSRHLMAGKTLKIPGTASSLAAASRPKSYKVRRGDTLSEIAAKYKVSPRDIRAWNGMSGSTVYVGQTLALQPKGETTGTIQAAKLEHIVRPGEFPGKIAARYGVKTSDLLKWNNLSERSTIKVNDKLLIYGAKEDPGAGSSATIQTAKAEPNRHKVVRGDTPGEIAEKYGIKLSQFRAWNGLGRGDAVVLGKHYYVSDPKGAAPAGKPTETETPKYKVQPGESPWLLAKKHGVSTDEILAWNGWSKDTVLRVGDAYIIGNSAGGGPVETTHKVTSGENPTTIARKYGVKVSDLFSWNGWRKGHVLRVGEEVTIRK